MSIGAGNNVAASDYSFKDVTKVTTKATIGTDAAGFTTSSIVARTFLDGKVVDIKLDTVNTSLITATAGDITDTTIFTLNAAYRPTELRNFHFSAGAPNGDVQINTDGTMVIRSANVSISASSNLRMSFMFIKD